MKVINIKWVVDIEEVIETINEMNVKDASELLEISVKKFSKMSDEQKEDYIKDKIHHKPSLVEDIMGLPSEVELPEEIYDFDDDFIADWLSNTYGFCHEGFLYENEEEKE